MTERLERVAFENNATGARIEGEFVADTGVSWMLKPTNKPVQALAKTEWSSVAPASQRGYFDDIFGGMR
jgi:hypothetical protein